MRKFFHLAIFLCSVSAVADRQFVGTPMGWHYGVDIVNNNWPFPGRFDRAFLVTVSNASRSNQHVRVTAKLSDGHFFYGAQQNDLTSQMWFSNSQVWQVPANYGVTTIPGVNESAGTLCYPACDQTVNLDPMGGTQDHFQTGFYVHYVGPLPNPAGYVWMDGNLLFTIDIADDKGAVTGLIQLIGGAVGSAGGGVETTINSISSTTVQMIPLNGGRPF